MCVDLKKKIKTFDRRIQPPKQIEKKIATFYDMIIFSPKKMQ